MALAVKVCGLTRPQDIETANRYGASYVGFIFYPPSPRCLTPEIAKTLRGLVSGQIDTVGVFVDPTDDLIDDVLTVVDLDILQLHGGESPERVTEIRTRTGRRIMKALRVAESEDLDRHLDYIDVTDLLLFDAKPPKRPDALPGGNGLNFDWRILQDRAIKKPWLLAGGITADNMATATSLTGAAAIDVSSGIEQSPGVKDPARMQQLLERAASLNG